MISYFWDCGVFYACACPVEDLPIGLMPNHIDNFSSQADAFRHGEQDKTHVSSKFITETELRKLKDRREEAVLYLLRIWRGEKINLSECGDLKTQDIDWIKKMIPLRTKWNRCAVETFFENLFAIIEENLIHLKTNVVKVFFDEYDKNLQQAIQRINNNHPDSINYATVIKYHTQNGETTFVTTDKNDYWIDNLSTKLANEGVDISAISLPEILFLPDYSASP